MLKTFFCKIRNFARKLRDDNVSAFAGQATLFIIISIFPFMMFLLSLIQYLPITQSNIMIIANNIFPTNISPLFIQIIAEVFDKGSSTIVSLTAITALWSASRGFLALVRGFNSVSGTKETRNYFVLRILSAIYTLAFALIIIVTLILLVFGNRLYLWIESVFPIIRQTALIVMSIRAVVGFATLIIFFLLLFVLVPNRKSTISTELPGAIIAAAGWIIFSYIYSFYIDNMANFSNTYGSLTAIVLLMLWLYFCIYILFIAYEINNHFSSK
ncbi:MAG: YihY/virulence factor BrkB family protein [Clostridiales bacterium]|jgi:membrane protein|nr:YihY/virulence factor BrkB family protein [Clostridiales bacterium]